MQLMFTLCRKSRFALKDDSIGESTITWMDLLRQQDKQGDKLVSLPLTSGSNPKLRGNLLVRATEVDNLRAAEQSLDIAKNAVSGNPTPVAVGSLAKATSVVDILKSIAGDLESLVHILDEASKVTQSRVLDRPALRSLLTRFIRLPV